MASQTPQPLINMISARGFNVVDIPCQVYRRSRMREAEALLILRFSICKGMWW